MRSPRSRWPTWSRAGMRCESQLRPRYPHMNDASTETELHLFSAVELRALIISREVSVREATEACLARIRTVDRRIGAFVTVVDERALEMADDVQRRLDAGAVLPFSGVPYALKDLTDTSGVRTTYGSRLRERNVPTRDAAVARRLREAGGVL